MLELCLTSSTLSVFSPQSFVFHDAYTPNLNLDISMLVTVAVNGRQV